MKYIYILPLLTLLFSSVSFAQVGEREAKMRALAEVKAQQLGISADEILDIAADMAAEPESEVFSMRAAPVTPAPRNLGGDGTVTLTLRRNGESVTITYRKNGKYIPEALTQFNHIMRCSSDGSEIAMPVLLLEMLDKIQDNFKASAITINSAYRNPKLNAAVGGKKKSLHMLGWAADIRIDGVSTKKLKDYAVKLGIGGVGYYPSKSFVHIDIGEVRYWVG